MKIGTHNGKFHSDDLFSVAMLLDMYPHAEVVRSRDMAVLDTCDIVLDVGGIYDTAKNRFDHHQQGRAGARPNGVPYSALGLIWQVYGEKYCGNAEVARRLFDGFISSFDAYDNGIDTYKVIVEDARIVQLQDIFDKYMNPHIGEPSELEDYDRVFMETIPLAQTILRRVVSRKKAEVDSEVYYFDQWQKSPNRRYVILDTFATSGDKAKEMAELLYSVYEGIDKKWYVKAMAKDKGGFELKKPLPQNWAGLTDKELADVTGVIDAAFCHNALFLCAAYSKDGAVKLMHLALEN